MDPGCSLLEYASWYSVDARLSRSGVEYRMEMVVPRVEDMVMHLGRTVVMDRYVDGMAASENCIRHRDMIRLILFDICCVCREVC